MAVISLVVIVELDLPHCLEGPNVSERHCDLDGLPFSTLGWGHTFRVICACVNNSVTIRLFRLQLQWDKHTTNGNVLDLQRGGLNLHLHLVGGAGEQLDGAVLAEALPVHLEEDRAVVGLDAQRDGEAHETRQVPHGWVRDRRGGSGGRRTARAATERLERGGRRGSTGRERVVAEGRLQLRARAVAAVRPGF